MVEILSQLDKKKPWASLIIVGSPNEQKVLKDAGLLSAKMNRNVHLKENVSASENSSPAKNWREEIAKYSLIPKPAG